MALRVVLRRARQEAHLTQAQLAKRMRSVQAVVSMIETGGRGVDVTEFVMIARAIGADPRDLLNEALKMSEAPRTASRQSVKRQPHPRQKT